MPVRCTAQYEILVFSTLTDILCFGDSTGSIIIDSIVECNEPYDVQWGGINNEELSAGLYNVFIVDSIDVSIKKYMRFTSQILLQLTQIYILLLALDYLKVVSLLIHKGELLL